MDSRITARSLAAALGGWRTREPAYEALADGIRLLCLDNRIAARTALPAERELAAALDRSGLVTNYNAVPWDDQPPQNPSGLRLGSPSMTTRGFREAEFRQIGDWIARVVDSQLDEHAIAAIAEETHALCADFPMP